MKKVLILFTVLAIMVSCSKEEIETVDCTQLYKTYKTNRDAQLSAYQSGIISLEQYQESINRLKVLMEKKGCPVY